MPASQHCCHRTARTCLLVGAKSILGLPMLSHTTVVVELNSLQLSSAICLFGMQECAVMLNVQGQGQGQGQFSMLNVQGGLEPLQQS